MATKHAASLFSRIARPINRCQLPQAYRSLSTSPVWSQVQTLLQDEENGFGFIRHNPRTPKPRTKGVTEIRGPYYSSYGKRHLQDVLETMGYHVDGLKFAGGSFSMMPENSARELIDLAHEYQVYVSTGG